MVGIRPRVSRSSGRRPVGRGAAGVTFVAPAASFGYIQPRLDHSAVRGRSVPATPGVPVSEGR